MEKEVLFRDDRAQQNELRNAEFGNEKLAEVSQAFNNLNFPFTIDEREFVELLKNPTEQINELVKKKLIPDNENSLPVNKEERLRTLNLPDIRELKKVCDAFSLAMYERYFDFLEKEGKIFQINLKKLETHLEEKYATIARNERESRVMAKLKELRLLLYEIKRDANIGLDLNNVFVVTNDGRYGITKEKFFNLLKK